jgi:cation diffusion facilitator CzcD-associated flavoprotein CzcO
LRYLNHVADRFDLRKDIQLETRVTAATFDETLSRWEIQTNRGDRLSARFCIMATGSLSDPKVPDMKGLNSFKGNYYHTSRWPHGGINFTDRRVAVIGTGSSGIQCIPIIAQQASHVFVFQRTPNFSIPSRNAPINVEYEQWWKSNYADHRHKIREAPFGFTSEGISNRSALSMTSEERLEEYEARWKIGGLAFQLSFNDLFLNKEANDTAAEFVRSKIRATVKDPAVAEALLPYNHCLGTKRLCVENHYYETYNRDNVTLVDLRNGGIDEITPTGLRIKDKIYEVDNIVFATGFHAVIGALLNIDICGRSSKMLKEKWADGIRNYLGIMIEGFPNLFTITGPGSPSVLAHMIPSIEQHVEWITECLEYLGTHNFETIEPTIEAENTWAKHINEVADSTLFSTVDFLYTGTNIPGKSRIFLLYAGGVHSYRQKCEQIVANGYEGFCFTARSLAPSAVTE